MKKSAKHVPEESVLSIDENELDREWTDQPRLYFRWAREAADARAILEQAKAELELTRAEVDSEIRSSPESFGIEGKVTEKAVECRIVESASFLKASSAAAKARHDFDVLSALVSALDHRKSALENLSRLFLANYYAEPRAPEGFREELEEMVKDRVRRKGRLRRDESRTNDDDD